MIENPALGSPPLIDKIVVFADSLDQFESFKEKENHFNTDIMVYFNQSLLQRMIDCFILDIRKTNKDEKHIKLANFPKWKKIY